MYPKEVSQPKRRSARIIALQGKIKNDRKAPQLPSATATNKSQNLQAHTKIDKENMSVTDVGAKADGFIDDSSDYEDEPNVYTRKRNRKHKPLHQLFSSAQGGQYHETTARRTGIYDLKDKPEKRVFESVLDALQIKDPQDYFGEPVNPNEVEGYYDVIKQPMDLGTMRAKLHENMYATLEELEHDVYLMCNNARTYNARSSVYHRVASSIKDTAQSVFFWLRANPESIELDALRHKRRARRIAKPKGRPRRPPQLPTKDVGESSGAQHEVEEKRKTYSPLKEDSLALQVLQGPKQNFELNKAPPSYEENPNNFTQGLGSEVKWVDGKKLETLELKQHLSGKTASQNQPINSSDHGIMQQVTRQATLTHQEEGNYGAAAAAQDRNIKTNIENGASAHGKGKAICVDEGNYDATAAAQDRKINTNIDHGAIVAFSVDEGNYDGTAAAAEDRNIDINVEHGTSVWDKEKAYFDDEGNYDGTAAAADEDSKIDINIEHGTSVWDKEKAYFVDEGNYDAIAADRKINTNIEHAASVQDKEKAICVNEANYNAISAAQDRNISTNVEHGASVLDKGKAICVDKSNYHATAAALLGSTFKNYEKGESSGEYHGEASSPSNIRNLLPYDLNTDLNTCDPSMDQMVPTSENEAPVQVRGQDSIHHETRDFLQLIANNNEISGWSRNPPRMSDTLPSNNLASRPSRVHSQVWPTRVISGPQPNHSESLYWNGQSLLSQDSQPFFPYHHQPDFFHGNYNYSAPLQVSHQRASAGLASAIDPRWQAVFPPRAAEQAYWLSPPYQPGNFQQQLVGSSYYCRPPFSFYTYGYAGVYHPTPTHGYGGTGPMSLNTGNGGRASLHERTQEGNAAQHLWNEENNLNLALKL